MDTLTSQILFDRDLILIIYSSTNITTAKDYKVIIATCRLWHATIASPKRVHIYMNAISTFIMQNNSSLLAYEYGKYITMDIALKYADTFDDFDNIATNKRLTLEFVKKYKTRFDEPDSRIILSANKYLSINVIRELKDILYWNEFSSRCLLSREFITEFRDLIDDLSIQYNPSLTWEFLDMLQLEEPDPRIYLEYIEFNDTNMRTMMETHSGAISQNPHLPPAFIREFADKINWRHLEQNCKDTSLLREFIDRIDLQNTIHNKLDDAFIREYLPKLDMYIVSRHGQLSLEFIREHMRDLNCKQLIQNKCLTLDIIHEITSTFDDACWMSIATHRNATIEFLQEHREKIINAIVNEYNIAHEWSDSDDNNLTSSDSNE